MRSIVTFLCIAGPFLGSLALFAGDRRSFVSERIASAGFLALFLQLACLRLLGLLSWLRPVPIAITSLVITGVLVALACPQGTATQARVLFASFAGEARSALSGRGRAIARLSLVAIALTTGLLALQGWLYRSTAWDSVWYHLVMTHEYVIRGSTTWRDVPVPYAVGYPNAVELLTALPCALLGTTELDDTGQLPFGIVGVALVVAWVRRSGASLDAAMSVAAAWIAIPAVFLSMTSNLNDVAHAVALAGMVYFLWVAPRSRSQSWMVLVCASLVLAIKGTGLLYVALLSPLLTIDQLRGAASSRVPALDVLLRTAALLWVGFYRTIENVLHTGNPTWPLKLRIPFTSVILDGPFDPRDITWNGMRGLDSYFFTGEGDAARMLRTWYDFTPAYEPNMTSGGFGPVHAILGVPALCCGLLLWRRTPRNGRVALGAAYVLLLVALCGPSPWIPRFVLGGSIASMVVIGIVLSRLDRRASKALSVAALVIAAVALPQALPTGIHSWDAHGLVDVLPLSRAQRAALPVGQMWPQHVTMERDRVLDDTEALGVDTETWLIGQYYPWAYQSGLIWFPAEGAVSDYLRRAHEQRIRWVTVGRERAMVRRLDALGARRLFASDDSVVFELPVVAEESVAPP